MPRAFEMIADVFRGESEDFENFTDIVHVFCIYTFESGLMLLLFSICTETRDPYKTTTLVLESLKKRVHSLEELTEYYC